MTLKMAVKDKEMALKIAEKDKEMALKMAEKDKEMALKIAEKDKEMALKMAEKDKEMTLKLTEKDKELALKMAEKDGELKKENEHKIETVKMKDKMEKTIESLRNEVQMLKTNVKDEREKPNDQTAGIHNDAVAKKEERVDPLKLPLIERLEWGVNYYIFTTNNLQGTPLHKTNYQEWYENLANVMVNEELYKNERFLFMRKFFFSCQRNIRFINYDIDKKCRSFSNAFVVKGLDTQLLKKGEFVLLHPKDSLKSSRTNQMLEPYYSNGYNYKYCEFKDVPEEIFVGLYKIAIVCWVLKDN
uniref:Uncharacterized protein n=1 Tax=Clytia hemisphaerica TaxID=252671 RepID=A0A7M6DPZ6_9CNID